MLFSKYHNKKNRKHSTEFLTQLFMTKINLNHEKKAERNSLGC